MTYVLIGVTLPNVFPRKRPMQGHEMSEMNINDDWYGLADRRRPTLHCINF